MIGSVSFDLQLKAFFQPVLGTICVMTRFCIGSEKRANFFQIIGHIHAYWDASDFLNIDPHPSLKRTELFKLFADFKRGGRQSDKLRKRLPAIGIKSQMLIKRAGTERGGRAREI